MKKLAVDMDGVLADYFEQFVRYEQAETGIRKTTADGLGKSDDELFSNSRTYLYQPGFFRTMPVIPNSQETLYGLNKKFDVIVVSSATEFPQSLTEKQAWLNEHFPFISWEQMVFCGKKTMINADIMIDDHFKNLDHFDGKTILFSQPHNFLANSGRHTRVQNWQEIAYLLRRIPNDIQKYYIDPFEEAEYAPVISKYA